MHYVTFSRTLNKISNLSAALFSSKLCYVGEIDNYENIKAVVGWGVNNNSSYARSYSKYHNIPYIALEDGFLCSMQVRSKDNSPFSIIYDDVGIYYDATKPSLLENILNSPDNDFAKDYRMANDVIELIRKFNLTKYNHACEIDKNYFSKRKKNILIIDQTYNDMSVIKGMADYNSFIEMYNRAIADNPNANIYLKVHPEVISGKKKGYLYPDNIDSNVQIIAEDINPISILKYISKVYTVSSQLGFEAIMLGIPVACFGMPFYAGWGLTEDSLICERRTNKNLKPIELVIASLIRYPKYIDQLEGKQTDILSAIDKILFLKSLNEKNKGTIFCFACGTWRYRRLRKFLQSTNNIIHFVKNLDEAKYLGLNEKDCKDGKQKIYVWGSNNIPQLEDYCQDYEIPLGRIEDGFIRSIGLGSDLIQPLSLCIDGNGIYYDPNSKSDLEEILKTYHFDSHIIARADYLIAMLNHFSLSKYNVGLKKKISYNNSGKKVILVPGQVEDDAAIEKGCGDIRDNLSLLKIVRKHNPRAFIIYKVHPDIIANNRKGHVPYEILEEYCDVIEEHSRITDIFNITDEVHTMTSLSGFEALIRGIKVYTYGMPFYAGWSLTKDYLENSNRTRKLSLHELVAGSIILYPRYYNWDTNNFEMPENTINRIHHAIADIKNTDDESNLDISTFQRRLRQMKIYVSEVLSA